MSTHDFYLSNRYRHRCFCGRFITLSKRYGWEAGGEFGEETFFTFASGVLMRALCLKGITVRAMRGGAEW